MPLAPTIYVYIISHGVGNMGQHTQTLNPSPCTKALQKNSIKQISFVAEKQVKHVKGQKCSQNDKEVNADNTAQIDAP